MRFIILVIALSPCFFNSVAQVRQVKDRAYQYKNTGKSSESRRTTSSGAGSGEEFLSELIFELFFNPIITVFSDAQTYQLDNDQYKNWIVSLEVKGMGGVNYHQVSSFDSQVMRGNYGLFSMQIRRFSVDDVTGRFTTLDWQLLQLNLFNHKAFRWLLGFGVSRELEVNQAHAEFTTEVSASMLHDKLMPSIAYRRSGDGYPRREFSVLLEFRPFRESKLEFSISAGYTRQKLYDIPFNFCSVGLNLYLK